MQTLHGQYNNRTQHHRVGIIVLQSDQVMEHELRCWLAQSIELLHSRIPNKTLVNEQNLLAMQDELPASAALLPTGIAYDAVVFGCTSATTLMGEARVTELIQGVVGDVPVTNPLTAVKAQLAHLQADRIAVLTPYTPTISQAMLDHLGRAGFSIVQAATFNQPDDTQVARLSRESVLAAVVELGTCQDCDAVFGACTNLRALDLIAEAEQRIGKPVITSNSALAWHVNTLLNSQSGP